MQKSRLPLKRLVNNHNYWGNYSIIGGPLGGGKSNKNKGSSVPTEVPEEARAAKQQQLGAGRHGGASCYKTTTD